MSAALGGRVRALRERAGMTQEAFARAAGMNKGYAWRVEAGRQNLSLRSLGRVALVLGVSMSELFDGIEPDKSVLARRAWTRRAD